MWSRRLTEPPRPASAKGGSIYNTCRTHEKSSNGPKAIGTFQYAHSACPRRLCQPPWTHTTSTKSSHLSGGTKSAEPHKPNARRSSGERGLGGEVLLSEKRPLPPARPPPTSLREGARGRGLLFREVPSLAIHTFSFTLLPRRFWDGEHRCRGDCGIFHRSRDRSRPQTRRGS